jgi:regulatory protein
MRIESLKTTPDRAGRYTVQFDDGTVMRLYRQTVEDFALYTGMQFTDEEYQALLQNAQKVSARMRAVRIVSAAGVSKKELESRLIRKGEHPGEAKQAVAWLEDLHLVDDVQTARQIVYSCISKGYGEARARQVLFEKRIPKELWNDALADYPVQSDKISDYLKTRITDPTDRRQVRRAVDALMRRGHSYRAIREAFDKLSFDSEDLPEDDS